MTLNILKCALAIATTLFAMRSFADVLDGSVEYIYAHEHFTEININGAVAEQIYKHLQVPLVPDPGSTTKSKISSDGRMVCSFTQLGNPAKDSYECSVTFDSSTGSVHATWQTLGLPQ